MKTRNSMGYVSVETKNITGIVGKEEIISMFKVAPGSNRKLTKYDLSVEAF